MPSPTSGWSSPTTPQGFPCCARFPCVHAAATTPAWRLAVPPCSSNQSYQPSPVWPPGRPTHRPFRGLLGIHSRCGLHTRAVTVCRDMLNRRLQTFRHLHACSGYFRLEHLPGGACTHWKAPPFHGARQKRTGITVRYWPSAGYIAASSEKAFAILVRAPVSCDQWSTASAKTFPSLRSNS
jgi:hypothetical protein